MLMIEMPGNVRFILSMLQRAGYEAYIVGGCVRDGIIGNTPHDWDICTSAKPEQIIEVFNHFKVITTGIKHGTVTLVKNEKQYEITTYRIDGEYDNSRHPSNVVFTNSLETDLSRRDFTINAMAYNDKDGVIDIFGGLNDIKSGVIRCVGNPKERFLEDALRILRAIRFAIRYNFNIEDQTLDAMCLHAKSLQKISAERINSELTQIILGESNIVSKILCETNDIFVSMFPQLSDQNDEYIDKIKYSEPIKSVRLALLFDYPEERLKNMLQELRYDNDTVSEVLYVRSYGQVIMKNWEKNDDKRYFIKCIMRDIGYKCTQNALSYSLAYSMVKLDENMQKQILSMKSIAMDIEQKQECYKISQLALNGNDIQHFGYQGKDIGIILRYLLDMVMNGTLKNEKKYLEEEMKRYVM